MRQQQQAGGDAHQRFGERGQGLFERGDARDERLGGGERNERHGRLLAMTVTRRRRGARCGSFGSVRSWRQSSAVAQDYCEIRNKAAPGGEGACRAPAASQY